MTRNAFFVEVLGCRSQSELDQIVQEASGVVRVDDSGLGTADDPNSAWLEVRSSVESIARLRRRLSKREFYPRVRNVVQVRCGEGKTLAKQLGLFLEMADG